MSQMTVMNFLDHDMELVIEPWAQAVALPAQARATMTFPDVPDARFEAAMMAPNSMFVFIDCETITIALPDGRSLSFSSVPTPARKD